MDIVNPNLSYCDCVDKKDIIKMWMWKKGKPTKFIFQKLLYVCLPISWCTEILQYVRDDVSIGKFGKDKHFVIVNFTMRWVIDNHSYAIVGRVILKFGKYREGCE